MFSKTAKVFQSYTPARRLSVEDSGDPPPVLKDEVLVDRAQKDDQWAIEELIGRYQDRAYSLAYHMCAGDREEAQDLTQEAFLKVFRNIKKFRGKSSFYTWFYRIVVNTCLDARKRRQRWQKIFGFRQTEHQGPADRFDEHPDRREENDPLAVLGGKQLSQEIRKALGDLPDKQRMVFQLKVIHGMRIREIAEVMESAEGTIKTHLFRATRFLRKALEEWVVP